MIPPKPTWYTYNVPSNTPSTPSMYIPYNFNTYGCFDDFADLDAPLAAPISKQAKVRRGNAEGYECLECQDFYPMAELNEPENATECRSFRCYGCRKGLRTIFESKEKNNG